MPAPLGFDARRQRFVAEVVLPDNLGRKLRTRYPEVGSVAVAIRGLRQWLRLHVLATDLKAPHGDAVAAALTFAMACFDEGIDHAHPLRLPLLFTVDDELNIPNGQRWALYCGRSACSASHGQRCVRHELLPRLPDRLPRQIRFHVPGKYPVGRWSIEVGPRVHGR
jgi:hypothetical protein